MRRSTGHALYLRSNSTELLVARDVVAAVMGLLASQRDYIAAIVAEGERRIARQAELVRRLDVSGHQQEARMARELLATITETVQMIALNLRR